MKIDKRRVIDATEPLNLKISKTDCAKGNVKDPGACAAARALLRIPSVKKARVHISRTYILTDDGNWYRYLTPATLAREVVAFDRGGRSSFEPGDYKLGAIPRTSRTGAAGRKYKEDLRKNKPSGTRGVSIHRTSNVRAWGANK